jgi:hypothetical protein
VVGVDFAGEVVEIGAKVFRRMGYGTKVDGVVGGLSRLLHVSRGGALVPPIRMRISLALLLTLLPACGYSSWDPSCEGSDDWPPDPSALRVVLTDDLRVDGVLHHVEIGPDATMSPVLLDRYGTSEGLWLNVVLQTDEDLTASCVEVRAQVTVDGVATESRTSTRGAIDLSEYPSELIVNERSRSYLVRFGVPIDDLSLTGPLPDARVDIEARAAGYSATTSHDVGLCRACD